MRCDRRALLGGAAAALIVSPARAQTDLRAVLDAAAKLPPADALARLKSFDARTLKGGARLDLITARAGLAVDVALVVRPGDYALRLRRTLGGRIDPRDAEARLTRELAHLHARAAKLFSAIGIAGPTIGARYRRLFADARYLYPDTAAAVADMQRALRGERARAIRGFPGVPAWCFDCDVRALRPAEIAAGKQGYRDAPTPTMPGAYIVDLKYLRRRPRWSLPSVVAHELLPGHMIQAGVESITPPHPLRLTYAAPFAEGWSIYAEQLAAAEGAFADSRAMLGHLHWLIFRVARGLVDIGMHLHGWSDDRALAALVEWLGEPAYYAPFDIDLPKTRAAPAARLAEAMLWLAIADRAPANAAARRHYHHAVLTDGRKRIEDLP